VHLDVKALQLTEKDVENVLNEHAYNLGELEPSCAADIIPEAQLIRVLYGILDWYEHSVGMYYAWEVMDAIMEGLTEAGYARPGEK
jgi:hypothetical protein